MLEVWISGLLLGAWLAGLILWTAWRRPRMKEQNNEMREILARWSAMSPIERARHLEAGSTRAEFTREGLERIDTA